MIHNGWSYVDAAYAVTIAGLVVLTFVVVMRLRHWSRQARALEKTGAQL
jgi:hypothetical protein